MVCFKRFKNKKSDQLPKMMVYLLATQKGEGNKFASISNLHAKQ